VNYSINSGDKLGVIWSPRIQTVDNENNGRFVVRAGTATVNRSYDRFGGFSAGFVSGFAELTANGTTASIDLAMGINKHTNDVYRDFTTASDLELWYAFGGLPGKSVTPIHLEAVSAGDTTPIDDRTSFPLGVAGLGKTDFLYMRSSISSPGAFALDYSTPALSTVLIPHALPGGDADFLMQFPNGSSIPVQAGQEVDLSQYGLADATRFTLSGLNLASLNAGPVDVDIAFKSSQSGVRQFGVNVLAVPEPSTVVLMLAALPLGCLAYRRR
jgi:hypothetical protein